MQLQLIHEVAGSLDSPGGEVITNICAIALRMLRGTTTSEPQQAQTSRGTKGHPSAAGEAYDNVASMRVRRREALTNKSSQPTSAYCAT